MLLPEAAGRGHDGDTAWDDDVPRISQHLWVFLGEKVGRGLPLGPARARRRMGTPGGAVPGPWARHVEVLEQLIHPFS